jgi:hypothetical protein
MSMVALGLRSFWCQGLLSSQVQLDSPIQATHIPEFVGKFQCHLELRFNLFLLHLLDFVVYIYIIYTDVCHVF